MKEELLSTIKYNGKFETRYINLLNLIAPVYVVVLEVRLLDNKGNYINWTAPLPTVTASGVMNNSPNWLPKYAVDGDDNTLWHCNGNQGWLRIDLNQIYSFDKIIMLNMLAGDERPQYFIHTYDLYLGKTLDTLTLAKQASNAPMHTGYNVIYQ